MRREIENRPLLIALVLLVLGITSLETPWNLIFVIPMAYAVRPMPLRLLGSIALVAGLLLYRPAIQPPQPWDNVALRGRVTSWNRSQGTFRLASDFGEIWVTGEGPPFQTTVEATGLYYPGDGIRPARLRARSVQVMSPPPAYLTLLSDARRRFEEFLGRGLASKEADLDEAICFGTSAALSIDARQDLNASGLTFLVTSAGLHILLLVLGVQAVLGRLPVPRSLQMALLVVLLIGFIYLSAFQISVIRASIVALLVRSAYLFRREPDPLSAISFAGLALLLFDPLEAFSPGFQLTMVASFAICLFLVRDARPAKTAAPRWAQAATSSLRFSLVGMLATGPILLQAGHAVALESVVTAPLAILVLPPIIVFTAVAWMLGPLGVPILHWAVAPLLGWFEAVTSASASTSWLHIQMPPFSGHWLVLLYGAALLTWRQVVRRA